MNKLETFDYHYVALSESHWLRQRTQLIETYLAIDNNDLLHYFRNLAGIADCSNGLVGWYGNNACTFGQKLGAFARLYSVSGDERLKEKAYILADEWGKCARKSQAVLDVNGTYVYDKLMGGFLDMLEYLYYEPAKEYIMWLTESAQRRFDKNVARDGLQTMEGGMIEWYTLPEQLYRAWLLTGEKRYQEFAKEWDYPYFWDKLLKHDYKIGPRHAYSHVNSLSSAAMAYKVTGDMKYLQAMESAYEELLRNHTFATGGYGPAETLFGEEGYLGDSLKANWDRDKIHASYRNFADVTVDRDDKWGSCEVSCCSWAVFKLCNYLLMFTGKAKYGDWAEKMLYNACGGQPPITDEGKVLYYADYFVNGGFKSVEDGRLHDDGTSFEWQCCTGTFPLDVAEYSNMLYYKGTDALYVSQYLPSKVTFTMKEVTYSLENESFYPKEKKLRFRLRGSAKRRFSLCFRVPSWADGQNEIRVNVECVKIATKVNTWIVLDREWQDGDVIEIDFEFKLRFEPIDSYSPQIMALCYGPVVLVCNKMTKFVGNVSRPEEWLEPIQKDGYSYAFRTKSGHVKPFEHLTRDFYPYYEVPQMQWYYMYHDISS